MTEVAFFSNKTRKELYTYFFISLTAITTWILQVSVFSRPFYFDTNPNLMLIGAIYLGLTFGPTKGTLFGIVSSFFIASILYDHTFYFSYPVIGLLAGLLSKNIFSDELLLFILLSCICTFPAELLNGWQYSLRNETDIFNRYLLIGFNGAILNLFFAPFFYFIMRFVTKKLKLR